MRFFSLDWEETSGADRGAGMKNGLFSFWQLC